MTFKSLSDGKERRVSVPGSTSLVTIGFSPNGRHYALGVVAQDGVTLRVVNPATGQTSPVADVRLNAMFGLGASGPGSAGRGPCEWADDSSALDCPTVPARDLRRLPPPQCPRVRTSRRPAAGAPPCRRSRTLLKSGHDEALFEYDGTSQIVRVDAQSLKATPIGAPGLTGGSTPSPDGRHLLVDRIVRPFSWLVPFTMFPHHVEIWSASGQRVKTLAELPMADAVPVNGVTTGPRSVEWHASAPATVVWAEALDKGDPRVKVPHRDRVLSLAAPFTGAPSEVAKTEWRFRGVDFTEKGVGVLTESDRPTRKLRTWLLEPTAAPRVIFERSSEDRYADRGTPLRRPGSSAIMQVDGAIYLSGQGASPDGNRPFLDRYDLATGKAERVFHCDTTSYETVVGLLDDGAARLVTRRESRRDPPNVMVLDRASGARTALTAYTDPAPQLAGVTREVLSYERADGVKLSATLLLPPNRKPGERLPVLLWAYPTEFADAAVAGQVSESRHRFITIAGPSHLLLLTQGYAILDNPTMPIVGPGETANDTYVEQLVASAKAAVDKVVSMGVADADRIAVGGHTKHSFRLIHSCLSEPWIDASPIAQANVTVSLP